MISPQRCSSIMKFVVQETKAVALEGAFRIHIAPEHIVQAGLTFNDLCEIRDVEGDNRTLGYGIVWRATEKLGSQSKRSVSVTSKLTSACGIKQGSNIELLPTDKRIVCATKVVLKDHTPSDFERHSDIDSEDRWSVHCAYQLSESTLLHATL